MTVIDGIFFDKNEIAAIKNHLGINMPLLPNVIEHPHVTFGFRSAPIDGFDKLCIDYMNSDGLILIIGYGNDSGNEGFLVEIDESIAEFYQGKILGRAQNGSIYGHITISYDKAAGRKPVDTGSIEFKLIDGYPVTTFGDFGYFDGRNVRYYRDEL